MKGQGLPGEDWQKYLEPKDQAKLAKATLTLYLIGAYHGFCFVCGEKIDVQGHCDCTRYTRLKELGESIAKMRQQRL